MNHYPSYEKLDLIQIAQQIREDWQNEDTFKKSLDQRILGPKAHFYEGPPGANGKPGIHHCFSRTLKDLFCRYKTMKGYHVPRKSGWDTHGLPVELTVEKELGITKEEIGKTISIAAYNAHCKKAVSRYQKEWEEMTKQIGYWLDLENPYLTCRPDYISSLWGILQALYNKGYLYKAYTIQPYSPAAGTGLSTHELNQPGCYKEVKDTTVVAQFALSKTPNTYLLAWTTTPWTLPANSALAINAQVQYVKIKTFNRYTGRLIHVVLAKAAVPRYFDIAQQGKPMRPPATPNDPLPWRQVAQGLGAGLVGRTYKQLLPYIQPSQPAFRILAADFVTTTEGTGIVHIAPSFGADDHRLAQAKKIPAITVERPENKNMPIVDSKGRFVSEITDFAGNYVKNSFDPATTPTTKSVDLRIAIKLKKTNKAFLVTLHTHSYPHCWRTDKPILYYPLDSWFIKTTACKKQLITLNKTIQWQPAATGHGRFGEWLEHLVDWNITRNRFWGTPLPIWRTSNGKETRCIGSLQELRDQVKKAVQKGFMAKPLPTLFDPHRPFVDDIILVSKTGKKMYREKEVVDVWFDSGAMPYAQHGTKETPISLPKDFPADFIVEGVDQTRGWFFTLHALSVLLHDSVAFKQVLATGLVLDKTGKKMSKRLGNAVEPANLLTRYGPDVIRWYMVANTNPWENLKFDVEALGEVRRKFFFTLFHTYQFFALYANLDGFESKKEPPNPIHATQSDRWILSKLQQLIRQSTANYDRLAPTQVARAIQAFVIDDLSNWYVRLNRKRFWQGGFNDDKRTAYHTLHHCLTTIAQLAAPIAPFYMDWLYKNLCSKKSKISVHLTDLPTPEKSYEDHNLEEAMACAQTICSLVHSLRKKHNIKVRQPLHRILVATSTPHQKEKIKQVVPIILSEVNIKTIQWVQNALEMENKRILPNLRLLGKRYGAQVKEIRATLSAFTQQEIAQLEKRGECSLSLANQKITLTLADVLITTEDISGWATARQGLITVALDLKQTPQLFAEGLAREFVNRVQHLRKEMGLAVEDKIELTLGTESWALRTACEEHTPYIMEAVQATAVLWEKVETLFITKRITLDEGTIHVVIKKFPTKQLIGKQ